ncbi:ATPase [uncultured Desulfatiglans sp.]|uniref:ATPase n=1 Tax=Uncultured Desulfatiglans sp. TaxID=1748965 RepID=A0A653A6I9_UNCDX|nr:ATPase [uncultured Desulfatiglans sp.]
MKTVLKRIIADFHRSPLPEFRRRALDVPSNLAKIVVIVGPRRAGKTYYLYQLMSDLEKEGIPRKRMVYLNFEDERLVLEGEYDLIFDAYRELYPEQQMGDVYFFFDEIQELPDWEKFVRRTADAISRHVFLTGSNARLLSREIATSLRGRSLSFEILSLSFAEYLDFMDISATDLDSSQNRALIGNAFDRYCLWGGFPEVAQIEDRFKARLLQEYFNVTLYRDLVERFAIRDTAILKYVLKRLVGSFTKEFSVNKLYNDLKSRGFSIGKDSLYRMADEIFTIYMLASVERYDPAVIKREMTNKKVYLYDNGFASALHYAFAEDRGKRLENVVFRHLRGQTEEIFFARNGWECDFVFLPTGCPPRLIQVTERLDRANLARELKGLTAGRQMLGEVDGLILAESVERGLDIPLWIRVMGMQEWLLEA